MCEIELGGIYNCKTHVSFSSVHLCEDFIWAGDHISYGDYVWTFL